MFRLLQFNSAIKRRDDVFAILEKNNKLLNFWILEKSHQIGYTFCMQHKTFCYNRSPLRIAPPSSKCRTGRMSHAHTVHPPSPATTTRP